MLDEEVDDIVDQKAGEGGEKNENYYQSGEETKEEKEEKPITEEKSIDKEEQKDGEEEHIAEEKPSDEEEQKNGEEERTNEKEKFEEEEKNGKQNVEGGGATFNEVNQEGVEIKVDGDQNEEENAKLVEENSTPIA